MNHKMSQEMPVGMCVQLYSEIGFVCHFFWREYLTLKSFKHSTGATGMGFSAAGLVATFPHPQFGKSQQFGETIRQTDFPAKQHATTGSQFTAFHAQIGFGEWMQML